MKYIIEKLTARWKNFPLTTRATGAQIILLILVSSIVFFRLGESSLKDYDEGIYAQVAKEMVLGNDWFTLSFAGEPWFEKPPLYMWVTAFLFKVMGINGFWARAASAFSGAMVVLFTYMIGTIVFDRRVGFLSSLPLITGYEFLRQARNGTTDVMLTLFILMALTAYISRLKNSNATWYLFSISFALGFMVKFWAALIVLFVVGVNIVIQGKVRATLSNKHFWGAILVCLALILPWHTLMYALHGQAFLDRYVLYDLLSRSTRALEGNAGNARYYLDRMSYDYSSWFLLLPIALTMEARRVLHDRDKSSVLLIFVACIFTIYSILVSTKIFHYLTPIYPLFAIFNANVIVKAYDKPRSIAFGGLVIAAFVAMTIPSIKVIVVFLLLASLMISVMYLARYVNTRLSSKSTEYIQPLAARLAVVPRKHLSIFLETFTERNNLFRLGVVIMCLFLTSIGILRSRSLYTIVETPVEQISRLAGSSDVIWDETIIALALGPDYENAIVGPAAMFYSDRPIIVAWSEDQLSQYTSDGPREIIMAEIFIESLNNKYEFTVMAESPPFIYGIIQQRDTKSDLQP